MKDALLRTTGFVCAGLMVLSCGYSEKPDAAHHYVRTEDGFLLVLREGDDAFAHLSNLAMSEKIKGASVSGFGFGHATFGYFDQQKKDFDRREFREVEIASLTGSIAWKEEAPALHIHALASDRNFAAQGGHLLALQVGKGSLELRVVTHRLHLTRARDEALGADVLILPR